MAYQAKQRDPLFDSSMQAAIERRGHELLGLCLFGIGAALAAMLGTYSAEDPSFFSATDSPVQNLFGTFGASVAGPLYIVVGHGGWMLALVAMAWGVRLMAHVGTERLTTRILVTPLAVGLAAVYASTLAPGPAWVHIFGLGGLFGDTILGALLNILPVPPGAGVRILSAPLGLGMIALGLVAAGFTLAELRRLAGLAMVAVVLGYDRLLRYAALSAGGAGGIARSVANGLSERGAARAERRAARQAEAQAAAHLAMEAAPVAEVPARSRVRHQPAPESDAAPGADPLGETDDAPAPRRGLLASVRTMLRRQPVEDNRAAVFEPVPEEAHAPGHYAQAATEDRVSARIADAIRSRASQNRAVQPEALAGDFRPSPVRGAAPLGRAEPPLVRAQRQAPPQNPALLRVPGAVPTAPMAQLDDTEMPDAGYAPDYAEPEDDAVLEEGGVAFDSLPSEDLPVAGRKLDRRPIPVTEQKAVVQHPPRRPPPPSRKAQAEAQPRLKLEPEAEAYETPPLALLTNPDSVERHILSDEALEENARMLESVLDDYGVKGEIVSVRPGPVVTLYELEPAPGLKASRVIGLADDIARSMSALAARVSTVPGRSVIGIELPNANREKVVLREILSARDYGDANMKLPLALGKDISGGPVVANLAKMPHLLIAGTTGSGKSVAINTMILSLLYRLSPAECRLIMIDPKMLELSVYDGIPHLLSPVVTDPKKAVVALKWVVAEMEERYRKMSKMGVRNIEGYNGRVHDALSRDEMFSRTVQTGFDEETGDPVFETEEFAPEALPYIVVIVDEMADLMMVAGKEIEACIQRLAQMARASGIHLIMATQRPSVDVITGTIKANFPTRISFQVTSKIDSRTILGEMGAEQLLGMGDMLYMAGGSKITRVHGPFCSDEEVEEVVRHLKSYGPPEYVSNVLDGPDEENAADIDAVLGLGGNTDGEDALYDQAVAIVARDRKCSTSYIQRKLAIGYNKAARLVEQMEDNGVVGPSNSVGKREILVPEVQ